MLKNTESQSQSDKQPGLNGWVEAALFVVSISLLNIIYTMGSQQEVHVVVFIFYALLFSSIGMLLVTGFGDDWWDIVTSPASWIFGLSAVALESSYYMLLSYMAPAEATLTVRLTVPISVLIGWFFFSRRMDAWMALGIVIIILAVLPIFSELPQSSVLPAIILGTVCSLVVSIKTFASEFHPANRRAKNVLEKMRVTGLVVLTTVIALVIALLMGRLATDFGAFPQNEFFPSTQDFFQGNAIWLGCILGAPLLIAMNYLTFSSVVKIRTENFLAMSAFTPLIAWSIQVASEYFGLINTSPMGWRLLPLTAVGIIGVFIVIWAGRGQSAQD